MQVTARFISTRGEHIEMVEETIVLWEGATVKDLRQAMLSKRPGLDMRSERTKAAIGKGFVRSDTQLLDGDVVTFSPATREERF
jgi:molybdopterin converting factor small subunit